MALEEQEKQSRINASTLQTEIHVPDQSLPAVSAGKNTSDKTLTAFGAAGIDIDRQNSRKNNEPSENKIDSAHSDSITGVDLDKSTNSKSPERRDTADNSYTLEQLKERNKQLERLSLLKRCEGVVMANYDWLDMPDYPDNAGIVYARRRRDAWIVSCVILFTIFLFGAFGYLPAWIAGSALGALFVLLSLWVDVVRDLLFTVPRYSELMQERRKLEFRALHHIRLLEGNDGLVWKFTDLSEYNAALAKPQYQAIMLQSRNKKLFRYLKRKAHIRLYLMLILEAEKAYSSLKTQYFEKHRELQARGVDDLPAKI
ncbi:hypothetical protein OLMES_2979 [Oleiphilus messinensis]|uniref:Uncharacterized protein n=1 Tax=Oleiphilus messinensis TaxID=141451 RepID=A0A1Y0ICC2_9GAMM|nr:hypothetical protein [Oleiphilus messinensis]ARU57023.1 hypothetical protein OLMES_2979 [Oleiphilus messinensis]